MFLFVSLFKLSFLGFLFWSFNEFISLFFLNFCALLFTRELSDALNKALECAIRKTLVSQLCWLVTLENLRHYLVRVLCHINVQVFLRLDKTYVVGWGWIYRTIVIWFDVVGALYQVVDYCFFSGILTELREEWRELAEGFNLVEP